MAIDLNGVDFGGILYFGIVDYKGEKVALTGSRLVPNGVQTKGGNDQIGYAKIPVNSPEGRRVTIQQTVWADGTPEARAAAKVAQKLPKPPRTELVKAPR